MFGLQTLSDLPNARIDRAIELTAKVGRNIARGRIIFGDWRS